MNGEKYRKIPIEQDGIQFNSGGTNYQEIINWMKGEPDKKVTTGSSIHTISIETTEGTMTANRGDWIMKDPHGNFYPVKEAIHPKLFDPVEETA